MAAAMSTLLPALLLSGFIFPVDSMPWLLRMISTVIPARYFVHAIRAILLRGNGFDVIAYDLLMLFAYFLLMLLIAVKRFRRELA
jgi:ABC-2 type transport system permease protein